jgi:TrmH family RNA methyltransferase
MDLITSHRNARVKQARALKRRKERNRSGLFVVEGIRHVGEALEANAPLAYLIYAPDLLTSDFALELIISARGKEIPCHATTPEVFETMAGKEGPQGILAVAHQQWADLDSLSPKTTPWLVALVSPHDPGNLGTVLRTLDAVGARGLALLDGGVDPYHPTAVRASMGTVFWHPLLTATTAAFTDWVQAHGYQVYGTSAHGGVDYRAIDYHLPAVLLLGDEREGLTEEQREICTHMARLPMHGRATSLNLSVAAGVMLYTIATSVGSDSDEYPDGELA